MASHCLPDTLSVDFPVLLTLAAVICKHPFCGCELWHDCQLQVVEVERAVVLDKHGPEVEYLVGGHHHTLSNLKEGGGNRAHTTKGSSLELEQDSAV